MNDNDIRPTETETMSSPDGKSLRIVFRQDDGKEAAIHMARVHLPQLITVLQREMPPGQATPIDRRSLQIGVNFSLQGYEVRQRPNGHKCLVLMVDLLDQGRVVSIPLDLSPQDVETIIKMLRLGSAKGN